MFHGYPLHIEIVWIPVLYHRSPGGTRLSLEGQRSLEPESMRGPVVDKEGKKARNIPLEGVPYAACLNASKGGPQTGRLRWRGGVTEIEQSVNSSEQIEIFAHQIGPFAKELRTKDHAAHLGRAFSNGVTNLTGFRIYDAELLSSARLAQRQAIRAGFPNGRQPR
jgi:hypothetical protein